MRPLRLLLALFVVVSPAQAAVVVRPGPIAVGAPAPAALPGAAAVQSWSQAFQSFLRSPSPDLLTVKDVALRLAAFDPGDAAAKDALAPLAASLQAELPALLAAPAPVATEAALAAAQLKLRVLNFPAVRGLLPEASREAVGSAAWAYNAALWDRKGRDRDETIRAIASKLAEPAKASASAPVPAVGGADVEVEVLAGDITSVDAEIMVATVDEAGTCRGGLHSAIERAGGACYREAVEAKLPLKEGEVVLAKPAAAKAAAFKSVLFLSDRRERPLADVVKDGLDAANAAGASSLSMPVLRTGSVFGAIEKSYDEIVEGIRRGVELFAAEGGKLLKRVSFVVQNDSALAGKLQAALAGGSEGERERSLRRDLRVVRLSGRGYTLAPRPLAVKERSSPIYASLLKPWSLTHLLQAHKPVPVGTIEDRAAFSKPTPSVLNIPIKMPGTGFNIPAELEQFREFLQKIIDHEAAVNPELGEFYAYLTVDQNVVRKGATQRRPGVHIDGVQGARYPVKLPPEHLYSVSDTLGTVFYDQVFDLTRLDPAKHHVHAELERQAREEHAIRVPDFQIAFWDSYSVHRADVAPEPLRRTFVRVEFSRKKYDSLGDTYNPLFEYDWRPVARPIPADLDDRPLPPDSNVPRGGYDPQLADVAAGAPHTVKNLRGYLKDNLGDDVMRVIGRGKAPILIGVGAGRESLERVKALGWRLGTKVEKREGYHQVWTARDPQGRKGYVIQRVNGDDRILHIQSLLKLAGVPADRVWTVGATVSWREHYREVFKKVGHVPDLVFYGFANSAIAATLVRSPVLNARHLLTLRSAFNTKNAAIRGDAGDAHDLDGMSMQVLELADGRKVWFLHCLFGDLVKDLVGAAADHGAKNISYIGAAGSLEDHGRMGEVLIPEFHRKPDGSQERLARLPDIPGVPRRGVYLRVPTPNVGTRAWTAAARASGVGLIESELAYVLEELKDRPDVRLQAALVISEAVFGPDGRDMTQWSRFDLAPLRPVLRRVLDAALSPKPKSYAVKRYYTVPLGG